jgi:mycothiol synthase
MQLRPPTKDDADAVTSLVVAFDVDEYGAPDFELDDLLADWGGPGFDLERDAWVAETPERALAGYALLRFDDDADVFVHPEHRGRGIGTTLLQAVEQRALERVPPGRPVVVGQALSTVNREGRALLRRAGYRAVRTYWRMVLPLDRPPPDPEWPEGISVRTFDPERDARAVHELIARSFADNQRGRPFEPYEQWEAHNIKRGAFDPTLWFLAFAGDELAGCIVCPDYESEGWVRQLAVARGWRGRGLGLALLHQAFGEFRRRGRPHAALAVDSWNRTGAKRFYERAGMQVKREHTRFEKELQAAG